MKIEKIMWFEEEAVYFTAGDYEAVMIPKIGANIIELKHKGLGSNIIRTPETLDEFKSKPIIFGIPILFPPGRIEDGKYSVNGMSYELPINDILRNNHYHGIINKLPFTVTNTRVNKIEEYVEIEASFWSNSFNEELFKYFPHEFHCQIIYKLSKRGLEQKLTFENCSEQPMPLGVGFHTAFNIPFQADSKKENYALILSVGDKWAVDSRYLPTGKKMPLKDYEMNYRLDGIIPLEYPLNDTYTIKPLRFQGEIFNGAIIEDKEKNIKLHYEFGKEYKFCTVWNNEASSNFICIEPQTWINNAPNLKLSSEETGFRVVLPGEKWSEGTKIFID
ncbi:aldose 1-epimerase [uncultured Clostridium sp.]|uniref:aldose 1-epimerase n=1 Tax=uncultured Clostridium sp. TaxID=59620 RepID=UPI0028F0FD61|nr:aldose 1-epimerase [uncultured Clostridium sp.]